jgi:hypothetical protein
MEKNRMKIIRITRKVIPEDITKGMLKKLLEKSQVGMVMTMDMIRNNKIHLELNAHCKTAVGIFFIN